MPRGRMRGAARKRRRIASALRKFRRSGIITPYLAKQASKSDAVLNQILPPMHPPQYTEFDQLGILGAKYYFKAIFETESPLGKL